MADNVGITPGSGATIAADEVNDAGLGLVKVQYVKIMDGTIDGTTKAGVGSNGIKTEVMASPAADPATDGIGAFLGMDTIMQGLTKLTVKRAVVNTATSGDQQVVAAVTSKRITVVAFFLVVAAAVSVKWRSATSDISGPMPFAANGGIAPGFNPTGWVQTASGAALNINLSGNVQVSGAISYIEAS